MSTPGPSHSVPQRRVALFWDYVHLPPAQFLHSYYGYWMAIKEVALHVGTHLGSTVYADAHKMSPTLKDQFAALNMDVVPVDKCAPAAAGPRNPIALRKRHVFERITIDMLSFAAEHDTADAAIVVVSEDAMLQHALCRLKMRGYAVVLVGRATRLPRRLKDASEAFVYFEDLTDAARGFAAAMSRPEQKRLYAPFLKDRAQWGQSLLPNPYEEDSSGEDSGSGEGADEDPDDLVEDPSSPHNDIDTKSEAGKGILKRPAPRCKGSSDDDDNDDDTSPPRKKVKFDFPFSSVDDTLLQYFKPLIDLIERRQAQGKKYRLRRLARTLGRNVENSVVDMEAGFEKARKYAGCAMDAGILEAFDVDQEKAVLVLTS